MPDSIPVTDLVICNAALQLVGMPEISSLSAINDRAAVCNLHYPLLKRSVLSRYNWPWLIKQEQLAIDATAVPLTQYTNAFALPSLRLDDDPILVILSPEENAPPFRQFEIQDEHLHTNQPVIYIWFLSKDGELESKWPEYFVDFMVHALAARIAMPLTEDMTRVSFYDTKAWGSDPSIPGGLFAQAKNRDFQGKPPVILESFELIEARHGGL